MAIAGVERRTRIDGLEADELAAAGVKYVLRYVDNTFGRSGGSLSGTEVTLLERAGLDLLVAYERVDPAEYRTRDQGLEDGSFALAAARVTEYPAGRPILFPGRTAAYFRGVADVLSEYHPIGAIDKEDR